MDEKQAVCTSEQSERGNCSTIIVGKNASTTGKVIVGHNEDDPAVVVLPYKVPRMKHSKDEKIVLEDGRAIIPQVEETYAYYWSEMRASTWAVSFSDAFVNEWGVSVVSNSCNPCKESTVNPQDGQIGYGIRRLVAERTKTAREGVELAISLIEEYGYFSCRSYSICDKNEGWVLQISKGKQYVAKRVPDDEVFYMPNWYTIHNVDFSDTEHKQYYFSKNLVSFAMENDWYKPAKEGDYSDFDFAVAYNGANEQAYNIYRARNAWRIILEKEPENSRIFSAKLNKKYGPEDIKKILTSHFEGTDDDFTDGYNINPHSRYYFPLCNNTTAESCIIVFDDDPDLNCIWRTTLNPCISPYVPWFYGISKVPEGYNWYTPMAGQANHFHAPASDNAFNPNWAIWTFQMLRYLSDFDYKRVHDPIRASIQEVEAQWVNEHEAIKKAYKDLKAVDAKAATDFLTAYTCLQAENAWDWAKNMVQQLGDKKSYENSRFGFDE